MNLKIKILIVFIFFLSGFINSQVLDNSVPLFFDAENTNYEVVFLDDPDIDNLLSEDLIREKNGGFYRVGIAIPVNITMQNSGTWTKTDNGKVWRLKIITEFAQALALDLDDLNIPENAKLYIYNEERSFLFGPYTTKDKLENNVFASEIIPGNNIILEYSIPAESQEAGTINIADISYVYKGNPEKSYGESGSCQINVNCPEGDEWQDEKRGIAKIYMKVGSDYGFCSGTLVNNTSQNCEQYFITADHCGNGASSTDLNFWRFYFNYESADCSNPLTEPASNMTYGCEYVASSGSFGQNGSDFFLVKIVNPNFPDPSWNVYYNGWNRDDYSTTGGVCIHHPRADVKKISVYYIQPQSSSVGAVPDTHWRIVWADSETNHGVTEPGSSGSPLFDNYGYVIGTLTGGLSDCSSPYSPDYFGKIAYSWESNGTSSTEQLKPWLDPDNTGVDKLTGINFSDCSNVSNIPKTDLNIVLFPNPTAKTLNIQIMDIEVFSGLSYSVIDQYGKTILSKKYLHIQGDLINIDTQNIPDGIYVLNLIINGKHFRKRFVIINPCR